MPICVDCDWHRTKQGNPCGSRHTPRVLNCAAKDLPPRHSCVEPSRSTADNVTGKTRGGDCYTLNKDGQCDKWKPNPPFIMPTPPPNRPDPTETWIWQDIMRWWRRRAVKRG